MLHFFKMRFYLYILILIFFVASCGPKARPLSENKQEDSQKSLMEWNKEVVENEVRSIEQYLKLRGQEFFRTETGLYIFGEEPGDGSRVAAGDEVSILYSIELLDGTLCFRTDSLLPETIIIGRNRKPAGLNEGIKRLNEGGSTNLIIPHYLLHGIAGDRKNIPPITPALFKVRLVKVEKR